MFMYGKPGWVGFKHKGLFAKIGVMGREGRGGGGRRARRGDIKFLILRVLAERPAHGYDIIKQLEELRGGDPTSPGSVYPTLQMLHEAGYVTAETIDGKSVFTITAQGRELLAERAPDAEEDEDDGDPTFSDLRSSVMKLSAAVMQAFRESDTDTAARLREILDRTRKEIYALLSETK
jgi:DNA-binding PadR family transcriptional regulator